MGTCASSPPPSPKDTRETTSAASPEEVKLAVAEDVGSDTAGKSNEPNGTTRAPRLVDQLVVSTARPPPTKPLTVSTGSGASSAGGGNSRTDVDTHTGTASAFDFEFSVAVLNTAREAVCSKYRMTADGVYQVASPSASSRRNSDVQPDDEHFTPRHDFKGFAEDGKTLYQANAEAILEVISLSVREGHLPARVQGHLWQLCCNLGYLSCDCSRACTGKFQTVLEDFSGLVSLAPAPGGGPKGRSGSGSMSGPASAGEARASPTATPDGAAMLRATSMPVQHAIVQPAARRKSLSQADVLRKQRQAQARFKKGTKSLKLGAASARRLSPIKSAAAGLTSRGAAQGRGKGKGRRRSSGLQSDTSDTDDWDVGDEDVQVAEEGDQMLAIIDEPFSATPSTTNSPRKKVRTTTATVRLAMEREHLQPLDPSETSRPHTPSSGSGSDAESLERTSGARTCRCLGVVAEGTGPLKYMEDRHICLNADPFTVYKLGVGSEELAAVVDDTAHNDVYEALYGVIDGHGGELVAESLFIDFPRLLVQHPLFASDPKQAILATCAHVDERYVKQSVDVTMDQSGAVATFVLVRDGKLLVASVGDCRAVLSTLDGFAIALTHDHTMENSTERARVELTDAKISRGRIFGDLMVTRSFGDARHKPLTCQRLSKTNIGSAGRADDLVDYIVSVPEITTRTIDPSDEFIIVASDGLWDVFTTQSAVDFVRAQFVELRRNDHTIRVDDLARTARKLLKQAQRKGSRDNITVQIICLWAVSVDPNLLSDSDSDEDEDADEIVQY
eukprot:INCI10282.1.p1 GENE.INCI10282.1~~INCI10282.1.p1  ORF type:complete len:788 (+),score=122.55 INCI10282.1:542-2905(+)